MTTTDGIKLNFVRTVDDIFNPWELSSFISEFGNQYYKFDLLKNISFELQNGVSPKNIIILSNSIRRKYFSYPIVDLLIKSHFNSFQSIGTPISMFPNKKVKQISIMIKFYRRSNDILSNNLSSDTLTNMYNKLLQNSDFSDILDNIHELALEKAKASSNPSRQSQSINNLFNNITKEYTEFQTNYENMEKVSGNLLNNEEVSLKDYEDYFNDFFTNFESNRRPLVGIFYEKENKIRVLCSNHLRTSKKGKRPELDFKRYQHNSNGLFEIIMGVIGIGKTAYEVTQVKKVADEQINTEKEKQKTEKIIQENHLLKQEEMKINMETAKIKRDTAKEELKAKQQNKGNEENTVKEDILNIPNNYAREKMFIEYYNNADNFCMFLKRNKVDIVSEHKFDKKV